MYECCSVRRFLRLLVLDAIIFGLCFVFLFIGRSLATSAESRHVSAVTAVLTDDTAERDIYISKGYTPLSAEALERILSEGGAHPEKIIIITENADDNSAVTSDILRLEAKYGIDIKVITPE